MSTSHLHDDRFVTWVTGRNTAVALACWVAVALVAGCGAQSPKEDSAKSDSAVEATEAAQSTESKDSAGESARSAGVEEAGAGESQSVVAGLGSKQYPFTWEDFAVGDGPLGSLQPFANGSSRNPCFYAGDELKDFTRFGVRGRTAEVWLYRSWELELVTLICSAPSATIWGNTTGPGGSGLSVPCPEWAPHVDKRTRGLTMIDAPRQVGMKSSVTQSSGGYGSGGDGLWNYKFHNWSTTELTPTIWAICRTTPTP